MAAPQGESRISEKCLDKRNGYGLPMEADSGSGLSLSEACLGANFLWFSWPQKASVGEHL